MSYGYTSNGGGFRVLPLLLALAAGAFIAVKGCQEGPFGRKQINDLSPEQEAALGAQSFQQVLSEERGHIEPADAAISQTVRRIGLRLAAASQEPQVLRVLHMKPQKFQWEFRVVDSRQVNAFCLPGGKVVVYTAILPVCKDEDGLATVMGHEIGHALARHGGERLTRKKLEEIGEMGVYGSVGNMPPEKRAAIMGALGAAVQYGESLPFNRKQESEADHIGLILMAAAGYDPRSAVPFWERMGKLGGARPPEFTSTHPGPEHRAQALQGWMDEAMEFYGHSQRQDGTRPLPRP